MHFANFFLYFWSFCEGRCVFKKLFFCQKKYKIYVSALKIYQDQSWNSKSCQKQSKSKGVPLYEIVRSHPLSTIHNGETFRKTRTAMHTFCLILTTFCVSWFILIEFQSWNINFMLFLTKNQLFENTSTLVKASKTHKKYRKKAIFLYLLGR